VSEVIGATGHKKGPVRDLFSAHGWLLPDDQTVLPMRDITTTRTIAIFMADRASSKSTRRQRRLCADFICGWEFL